jgi:N-ethylmaleimide reductase
VEDYRQAAKNALAAGFDGVEVHGANGFLIDQFLQSSTNLRTDEYGGSLENRARFALEVVQAAVDVFGPGRVGYKMSPSANLGGIFDANPRETFSYLCAQLERFGLAYLHVMEALPGHFMAPKESKEPIAPVLRRIFSGPFILNGGYSQETAERALAAQEADLISFGVPFIANPDLVARFRTGAPLSHPDPTTFYGGTDQGYIDYPASE